MRRLSVLCLSAAALCAGACGDAHFISDAAYRAAVQADLATKRETLAEGDPFRILDGDLTRSEREALTFLYAYMPLSDIADCPGEFFLENYRLSERARREMPWGNSIPERVFRHFVLPVRVNNEYLDDARRVFYGELADRVKGLSMYDAVLEVNHWCHEKAVYTPSDARTSSPLATVRTASGRCGEESTLLVAALRSVAIPARQVYTPRWAHTDDNHAWVEAWADGTWYFLGACEPEPVLDLGWFNAPAGRGMLMHTKVFGRYDGDEETVNRTPNHTEINVTGKYAPTAQLRVRAVDGQGRPEAGATVEYKLYNYAEFYTVASRESDAEGYSTLTAGLGDLLVWVSKQGRFGFRKVRVGETDEVVVTLDRREGEPFRETLDVTPPSGNVRLPEVTPEQRSENDRRMAFEDSLRNAYTATFFSRERAERFAREQGLDVRRTAPLLTGSRGNHAVLCGFLTDATRRGDADRALSLLETLSEKDLRDVPRDVLDDHLSHTPAGADVRRVLCPRVANELLTPYRGALQEAFAEEADSFRRRPELLAEWCRRQIALCDEINGPRVPVSPCGVWRTRRADRGSRDIFFVSAARALGIPAYKDAVTEQVRYADDSGWHTVDFEASEPVTAVQGRLRADYRAIARLDDPKYYIHFTLSRFTGGGRFRLLNYADEDTWRSLLARGTTLDAGYYLLTTGTRMADGSVLAEITGIPVERDRTAVTDLVMREDPEAIRVIGSFDSEAVYLPAGTEIRRSILQTTGRGYFVVGVLGAGQEPTNHALRDLAAARRELEAWGRSIVLLFGSEAEYRKFDPEEFPGLPSNVVFGIDEEGGIRRMIAGEMHLHGAGTLPLFVTADTFNRVVFCSEGYTIGLGEQLTKVIRGL